MTVEMKALLAERPGMTAAQLARMRALADAYAEVTSGMRVAISATESVPARLLPRGTARLATATR